MNMEMELVNIEYQDPQTTNGRGTGEQLDPQDHEQVDMELVHL